MMTDKKLEKLVHSDNPWERARAARNGYGLDIFALYELTEGAFCNMLSFSTQYTKLLDFCKRYRLARFNKQYS